MQARAAVKAAQQRGIDTARRPCAASGEGGAAVGGPNPELSLLHELAVDEEYLQRVVREKSKSKKDLGDVTFIQLKVDLNLQSLLDLSMHLPSLKSLVLDESVIGSVRDLGVGLRCLISLSLNSCGLNDLDGIGVLTGLEDLSACDNFVTDASPLAMHDNLRTLNLSGNNLSDISIADALSSCPNLKSLFLGRNPIEKAPNYRLVVASLIPTLEKLDGTPVDSSAQSKVSNAMVLEAAFALHLADEEMDDEKRLELEIMSSSAASSGDSSSSNSNTNNNNSNTNSGGGGGGGGISNSSGNSSYRGNIPDTGSELTHGSSVVLAGNMAAAMRKRRNTATDGGDASKSGDGAVGRGNGGSSGSTLEVLDLALVGGDGMSGGGGVTSPFLGEGDVTASVMGQMFPASHAVSLAMQAASSEAASAAPASGPRMDLSMSPKGPSGSRGSARAGQHHSSGAASMSFDAESKDFTDVGVGGYLASVSNRGSRPKSAVPSSMRGSWVGPPLGAGMDAGALESLGVVGDRPSPRQRNGSRPQSAAATRATPSAPFKVEVTVVKDKAAAVFHEGNKAKAVNKKGAPRIDNDDDDGEGDRNVFRFDDDEDAGAPNRSLGRLGSTKSYIHKDLMLRGDNVDDDVEGIAVTRAARHQLMSASGRRAPGAGSETHPAASAQTVASRAGVSLGFDLKGSLAAIDQWVEEMGSDDDDDDDDDDDGDDDDEEEEDGDADADDVHDGGPPKGARERDVKTAAPTAAAASASTSAKRGPSPVNSDADSFGRTNPSSRSGSAGSNRSCASSRNILSRDKIFSMCSGGIAGAGPGVGGGEITPRSDDGAVDEVLFSAVSKLQVQAQAQAQAVEPTRVAVKKSAAGLPVALVAASAPAVATKAKVQPPQVIQAPAVQPVPADTASPPRVEADEVARGEPLGPANKLSDAELVDLLRRPPKAVPQLRTKSAFAAYFQGMKMARFVSVAERAFSEDSLGDADAAKAKVNKRLDLVREVLI